MGEREVNRGYADEPAIPPAGEDPDVLVFDGERVFNSPKLFPRFVSWLRQRRRDDRR